MSTGRRKINVKRLIAWLFVLSFCCLSIISSNQQTWKALEMVSSEEESEPYSIHDATIFPQLAVPFYVYENGLNWENATIFGEPIGTFKYPSTQPITLFKHSTDYWMLQGALRHPRRTRDPAEAKLFFVPTLMNILMETKHSSRIGLPMKMCVDDVCGLENLIKAANGLLAESKYFQASGGYDHILVSSHSDLDASYIKPQIFYKHRYREHLWATSKMVFEDRLRPPTGDYNGIAHPRQPRHISDIYVAHGCPHNSTTRKEADFAMVASMHREQKSPVIKARFQPRRDLCDWLLSNNKTMDSTMNFSVTICGEGAQCPALSLARYGFHVAGDTLGANRLQDTILSGTVPIFTDPRQYEILPPFIPWRELSEEVSLQSPTSFRTSLHRILQQPSKAYQAKLDALSKIQDALDLVHSPEVVFDNYMAAFATRMGFQ